MSASIVRWVWCGNRAAAALDTETDAEACARANSAVTIPEDNPEIQPPTTFTPDVASPITGLDPVAPGGPGVSKTFSERMLSYLFGDDEAAAPKAPASAGGCCPDGQPRCLRCWLRKNAGWLFLAALAVAAYLLRKK